MPQTCPHCGIALPAVVDAFCPECREDLSETPGEAQKTAEGTFNGFTENEEKPRKSELVTHAGDALTLIGVGVIGFVASIRVSEWAAAIVAIVFFVVGFIRVFGVYRQLVVRTSVTGKSKTSKGSERME